MRTGRLKHPGRGVSATEAVIALVVFVAAAVAVIVVLWDPKPDGGGSLGVADLQKVDPKLILYEEDVEATIQTGFEESRGIAVGADDAIYVAGDEAIHVVAPDGKREADVKLDAPPRCLAVDTDGTMYVATTTRVQVVDPAGKVAATWAPVGEKAVITSIAVM